MMASACVVLRTCGIIILFTLFNLCASSAVHQPPWLESFSVLNKKCTGDGTSCEYLLEFEGGEYLGYVPWALTPTAAAKGEVCVENLPSYELSEVKTKRLWTRIHVKVPATPQPVYFCLFVPFDDGRTGGTWLHQGARFVLTPTAPERYSKPVRLHSHDGKSAQLPLEENLQWFSQSLDAKVQAPINNNLLDNNIETEQASLTNPEPPFVKRVWIDLSRDIDVNYADGVTRTVENSQDVEMVGAVEPLTNQIEEFPSSPQVSEDPLMLERFRRRKRDVDVLAANEDESDAKTFRSKSDSNDETGNGPKTAEVYGINLAVEGIRVDQSARDLSTQPNGVPELLAYSTATLRLFGVGISKDTLIAFTTQENVYGGACQFPVPGSFKVIEGSVSEGGKTALVEVTVPQTLIEGSYYICAKRAVGVQSTTVYEAMPFVHQGKEPWQQFRTYDKLLPLWASILIIAVCLCFSALFSGLNLGLMALDRTELKIVANTGSERERRHAKAIMPVRNHGNYLLCSLLLGNVLVNSTFTILLDDLTSGLLAVLMSTLLIVLLGEITPQAICSRHGLAVGALTIPVTKVVMAIVFPLAYPVSKLLDVILGEEIGNVYNRERLKELVKVTNDINDLDKDEVNIISGALELRKKTVSDVMTKIEDVFMLSMDSVLDFETVSEIMKSGYSRIPVYEDNRNNIVTMLYIKDLAFVDPDDNTPLKTLCQFYQNPCNFVFEDITLDIMFRQFKEGHKGHMAFVHRVNNEGEGDPYYETIGLVTLEDVIEELIQAEIMDETDVFTDNRTKRRRNRPPTKLQDFGAFAEKRDNQRIRVSPQLTLATFQYLSTALDPFKPDVISETIMRRLLKQDIIHQIKVKSKDKKMDPATLIYQQGKAADYFVLILEGRVEVTVGRENLVFESGPFTFFGVQALMQNFGVPESPVAPSALGSLQSINMDSMLRHTFVPDYSVRAVTDVFYVKIKRNFYMAAKRATLMEKTASRNQDGTKSKSEEAADQFDDEVEKLLHSLDEEGSLGDQKTPSHQVSPYTVPPTSATPQTRSTFNTPPTQSPTIGSHAQGSPVVHQSPNGTLPTEEDESSILLPQELKPVIKQPTA